MRYILVPNVPVGNANFETLFQLNWIIKDSKANRMSRLVFKVEAELPVVLFPKGLWEQGKVLELSRVV